MPVAMATSRSRKGKKMATRPMIARGSLNGLAPFCSDLETQYLESYVPLAVGHLLLWLCITGKLRPVLLL